MIQLKDASTLTADGKISGLASDHATIAEGVDYVGCTDSGFMTVRFGKNHSSDLYLRLNLADAEALVAQMTAKLELLREIESNK